MTDLPPIPLMLRTRLAHATLQAIADDCGVDILHIKGPAIDAALLPANDDAPADATAEQAAIPRLSQDADVLVRPAHLKHFLAALKRHGWQRRTSLYSGGAVEHSVDWWYPELGGVDVHVRFPGIQLPPAHAFAELWRERNSTEIAHRVCPVPSLDAQRLLLLLHAARNGGPESADVGPCWRNATPDERQSVSQLATSFGAEVALAGATGNLNDYANRANYNLWRLLGQPNTDAFELWLASVRAAPTPLDCLRSILYVFRLKAPHLERPATKARGVSSPRPSPRDGRRWSDAPHPQGRHQQIRHPSRRHRGEPADLDLHPRTGRTAPGQPAVTPTTMKGH